MTQINFYRINGQIDAAIMLACQLTEKAFRRGLFILIHSPDLAVSTQLNQALWSFKPSSFLPHELQEKPTAAIAISHHDHPGEHDSLLINLAPNTPGWFSRFEKVVEVVYDDQAIIEQKRERYSFYNHRGYPLKYHNLTKSNEH